MRGAPVRAVRAAPVWAGDRAMSAAPVRSERTTPAWVEYAAPAWPDCAAPLTAGPRIAVAEAGPRRADPDGDIQARSGAPALAAAAGSVATAGVHLAQRAGGTQAQPDGYRPGARPRGGGRTLPRLGSRR